MASQSRGGVWTLFRIGSLFKLRLGGKESNCWIRSARAVYKNALMLLSLCLSVFSLSSLVSLFSPLCLTLFCLSLDLKSSKSSLPHESSHLLSSGELRCLCISREDGGNYAASVGEDKTLRVRSLNAKLLLRLLFNEPHSNIGRRKGRERERDRI